MTRFVLSAALLFTASVGWCLPSESRLDEIQAVADSLSRESLVNNVTFVENPDIPGPAWSFVTESGTFQVEVNPEILKAFSPSTKVFITYHELGHVRLGHLLLPYPGQEAAAEFEYEADAFAAFVYRRLETIDVGLLDFLKFIEQREGKVPPGIERSRLIRSIWARDRDSKRRMPEMAAQP